MQEIYKSSIQNLYFDATHKLLKSEWFPDSDTSDADLMADSREFAKVLEKYKPQTILTDSSKATYTIMPELQEQMNQLTAPVYQKIGLKKMAVILSQADLYAQVSIHQTIEENTSAQYEMQLFDNSLEAEKWLLN
jgi:hypothetical protein